MKVKNVQNFQEFPNFDVPLWLTRIGLDLVTTNDGTTVG